MESKQERTQRLNKIRYSNQFENLIEVDYPREFTKTELRKLTKAREYLHSRIYPTKKVKMSTLQLQRMEPVIDKVLQLRGITLNSNKAKLHSLKALYFFFNLKDLICPICNTKSDEHDVKFMPNIESVQVCSKACSSKLQAMVNKGRVHTEDTRKNMSQAHIGNKLSEETKQKLSASLTGIKRGPLSEEHKAAIQTSVKAWYKDVGFNKGQLNKMSTASKEYHNQNRTEKAAQLCKQILDIHENKYEIISFAEFLTNATLKCTEHGNEFTVTVTVATSTNTINSICPECYKDDIEQDLTQALINHNQGAKLITHREELTRSTQIVVECPKHGQYSKIYSKHLHQGCEICNQEEYRTERNIDFFETLLTPYKEKYQDTFTFSVKKSLKDIHDPFREKVIAVNCLKHNTETLHTPAYLYDKLKSPTKLCTECYKDDVEQDLLQALTNHNQGAKLITTKTNLSKSPERNIAAECPKHGQYYKSYRSHLHQGCPTCSANTYRSKGEQEVLEYIQSIYTGEVLSNSKSVIKGELDIYIPEHKLAIEYNGLYWHSTAMQKNTNYHVEKTNACMDKDIQLIHVFEDEWKYNSDIVKSRIANILGVTSKRIYARKTEIREVSSSDASKFLDANHIQGKCPSKHKIGLYYNDELISLMTFGSYRIVTGLKSVQNAYELIRFCNAKDTTVIGGASRLLKYFIRTYKPSEVMSYSCRRWSVGNLYKSLGFEYVHSSGPSYSYVINNQRQHRAKYQKHKLVAEGYDKTMTEKEIMTERGIHRIYDCGTDKWILNFTTSS